MHIILHITLLSSKTEQLHAIIGNWMTVDRIVYRKSTRFLEKGNLRIIERSAAATIPPRDANNFTIGNVIIIIFLLNVTMRKYIRRCNATQSSSCKISGRLSPSPSAIFNTLTQRKPKKNAYWNTSQQYFSSFFLCTIIPRRSEYVYFLFSFFSIPPLSRRCNKSVTWKMRNVKSDKKRYSVPFRRVVFSCKIVLQKGLGRGNILIRFSFSLEPFILHTVYLRETKGKNDSRKKHGAAYCNTWRRIHVEHWSFFSGNEGGGVILMG